jgi:hypothetical protein
MILGTCLVFRFYVRFLYLKYKFQTLRKFYLICIQCTTWTFLFITNLIVCLCKSIYVLLFAQCLCILFNLYVQNQTHWHAFKIVYESFYLCKIYLYASYFVGSCLFVYKFFCLYVFINFQVSLYAYLSMQVSLFMHLIYNSCLHHVYIFFMFPFQLSWNYV